MRRITIDLRMYRHSGIGRYLRNLMPLLLPMLEVTEIFIIATPGVIGTAEWAMDPRVQMIDVSAAIFSPSEQLLAFHPAYHKSTLLWVPHYNVPIGYRGRLAVTIHDLAPIALPETFSSGLKRRFARVLITRATQRAEAILAISRFTENELHDRLGVHPAKITVTHPGVDTNWPVEGRAHKEFDGMPYLLYVGNVKPNKNLKMLFAAFRRVSDRLPHRLVLAGRRRGFGTEDIDVLRLGEALGGRVRWTDEISDAELIGLYAGADALVLPSLYEGFGLPLVEAMHFGCPVLCSDVASLPEVGGDAVLLFDPRDELSIAARLLQISDLPLMNALRERGRERSRLFTYGQCATITASVLNRAMEGAA